MTPKVKEILKNFNFESKAQTHNPITKEELLAKLGAQEAIKAIKVEPDKSGNYPEGAYFVISEDGNGGDYFVDVAEITDEEYEELLPYVTLLECTKMEKKSNKTLLIIIIVTWILCFISCIALPGFFDNPWQKGGIIIGCLVQLGLLQTLANAIFENAENNKKVGASLVSLGIHTLKKNISNNKK